MTSRPAPQLLLGVVLATVVHCGGAPEPAAPTAPPRQVVDTEAKPEPAEAEAKAKADDEDEDRTESPPPAADPLQGLIAKLGTERLHSEYPITTAAFSPNGQELLTGGVPGRIERWNAQTGQRLEPLPLPSAPEARVERVLSPAGAAHLIASVDGKALVWTWPGRKLRRTIELPGGGYANDHRSPVAASQSRLAHLSDDGIVVEQLADGAVVTRLARGSSSSYLALALSVDGGRLAAATTDGIQVWEVDSGKRLLQTSSGKDRCSEIALSPDGKLVAAVCKDDVLRWDLDTGQLIATDSVGFVRDAHQLAFSADGNMIYARETTFRGPPTVRRFSARTKKQIEDLPGHDMATHPSDPTRMALIRGHGAVLCSSHGEACAQPEVGHTAAVGHLSWSRAGRSLVSSATDGTVIRWQLSPSGATGKLVHQDSALEARPAVESTAGWLGLVVSVDKKSWSDSGQALRVVGLSRLETRWQQPLRYGVKPVGDLATTPDGARLVAVDEKGDVELWSARQGKRALYLPLGEPEPEHHSLSDDPEPRRVRLAPGAAALVVTERSTGTSLWRLPRGTRVDAPGLGLDPCAFAPSGTVVVCTKGRDLAMRKVDAAEPPKTIPSGLATITHLAVSDSPPRIALVGDTEHGSTELRILDATTAQPLLEASTAHLSPITSLALIANAHRLITAHQDGWLHIWPGDGASL